MARSTDMSSPRGSPRKDSGLEGTVYSEGAMASDGGRETPGIDEARRLVELRAAAMATSRSAPKTEFRTAGLQLQDVERFDGGGRYRIEKEFRRGAMGVIVKAFDTHMNREVALKCLRDEFTDDPQMRQRFLQEAQLTGHLQHPGVVPVYDLHRLESNGLCFSMMYVKGRNLKELLRQRPNPTVDLPRFLNIFQKVCQTMAYAHCLGVIHRDLKPANVMVGEFGVVRVMDWGLGKYLVDPRSGVREPPPPVQPPPENVSWLSRRASSGEGATMGTLAYMAPEQARGDTWLVDQRADVFGLGAVLCEILTGTPPYTAQTVDALLQQAARAELDDAKARLDHCLADPKLVSLATACLHATPEQRPPDAGRVATRITELLESDLQRTALDMVRFFELSHDLFCLASLDGYFQRVNDNFPRVLGFTKQELQTRPFLDFVHPDDIGRTLVEMRKLSQGLPVVCFRNRYRDAAGDYHWLEWTAKSIPDENVIFAVARPDVLAPQVVAAA
jgi:PAS domain S-box-containing protein